MVWPIQAQHTLHHTVSQWNSLEVYLVQALQAALQPDQPPHAATEDRSVVQGMGALGRLLLRGLNPDPVLRPTMRSVMRDIHQAYDYTHPEDEPMAQIRSVMAEIHYDPLHYSPLQVPATSTKSLQHTVSCRLIPLELLYLQFTCKRRVPVPAPSILTSSSSRPQWV